MRRAVLAVVLGAVLLLLPASASASFHLIKIREVGNANPADYVELQLFSSGENFVKGHFIRSYNDMGDPLGTFEFPANVPNGDNQRTILVGRADADTWPVEPDFTSSELIVPNEGAVCYLNTPMLPPLDCVSFGDFAPATLPTGAPAPAIPDGDGMNTLQRSIAPGCATLLEFGDDTDDSATDFALAPRNPRNNATVPTEKPCDSTPPQTTITKHPPKRSAKAKAKFEFRSSEPGSTFECKLDKGPFKPCTSPFKKRVKPGKHRFSVAATDKAGNRDPSPAKVSFKRVRKG